MTTHNSQSQTWKEHENDEEHEEFDSRQLPYFYIDTHGQKQSLVYKPEEMRAHATLYSTPSKTFLTTHQSIR